MRSALGRARGLGSAKDGFHHWWVERLTAIALVPLTLWFATGVISVAGADYETFSAWMGKPWNAGLMIAFICAAFLHGKMGMEVIVEDYVEPRCVQVAVRIFLNLAAFALGIFSVVSVLIVALGG
ncbi:MAG: succinate dehydrogenase, hydrophobic membrane anchor protein [Rhodospirillaceae bacterium]|nr:succinate dehydrogenase, hydrophobic membrane anchor protein [Rhodospirillaceae bacterium]